MANAWLLLKVILRTFCGAGCIFAKLLKLSCMGLLIRYGVGVLLGLGAGGCQSDYGSLPTLSAERQLIQAVVEVPAGTNQVLVYNPAGNDFRPRQRTGTDQRVEFLPYPGNYGFIPGTRLAPTPGDSLHRPLPVLILAESQPTGTVLEIVPVGVVRLEEGGQMEQVVLAVPARPSQQILPGVTTWGELTHQYPAARDLLRIWFQQRHRPSETRIVSWKDERAAEQLVRDTRR